MVALHARPRISSCLLLRKKLERGQSLLRSRSAVLDDIFRVILHLIVAIFPHLMGTVIYRLLFGKSFELYDLQQAQAQATEINRSVADKIGSLTLQMSSATNCAQFVQKQSFIRAQLRRVTALSVIQVKIWMTPCWRPGNFGLKTRWLMIRNGITYCNVMLML